MGKKLYVGNLPFSATDQILTDTFSQCGTVESAKIIMDRDSGRSKSFGFVEMSTEAKAADAISKFNGADYDGRGAAFTLATCAGAYPHLSPSKSALTFFHEGATLSCSDEFLT